MPGSTSYEPGPGDVPLARPSATIGVFRYDPEAEEDARFELLPNVRCLQIEWRDGSDPPSARFRYSFVDVDLAPYDPPDPSRFEQVYPYDSAGPGVVLVDDRLCVFAFREDGYSEILFDGFAMTPQADLDAETETVSFAALGTPFREWDYPLAGAIYRDADVPDRPGSDTPTGLPARFNPDGRPNASPKNQDSGEAPAQYPVFLGPVWPSNTISSSDIRAWTLSMAARYVVTQGDDLETYVPVGDLTYLDSVLKAVRPVDTNDDGVIDGEDDASFEYEDITVPDVDVTGEAWPSALCRLIEPHGYRFRWTLTTDSSGEPAWSWKVWREDPVPSSLAASPVKEVTLQPAGNPLDPGYTNVGGLSLARDGAGVVNRVAVDAAPDRYEALFVCAPLFEVAAGDATTGLGKNSPYRSNSQNFIGPNRDKYRLYGFDEVGEGHWDFGGDATTNDLGDFAPVLNPDGEQDRPFAHRRRPGVSTLASKDDKGKPLRACLYASFDYAGPEPGVWDGTGTWQRLDFGEWKLLDDRLGFVLTMEDPNSFSVGVKDPASVLPQLAAGKFNNVEWTADPTAALQRPRWALLCSIDADRWSGVIAERRAASPTSFQVTRRVDGRDRFHKVIISRWSILSPEGDRDDAVVDDTDLAKAQADASRRAGELGTFAGTVTIPRLSTAYAVGDRIDAVAGRGVSLRSNAAAEQGESPVYPSVVGITWDLDGRQTTTLSLSDRRAEPPPRRRGRVEEGGVDV
jgi:hypothetical protein